MSTASPRRTLVLGATEMGLGACMLTNVKKDRLAALLKIPPQYQVLIVIALGKAKRTGRSR